MEVVKINIYAVWIGFLLGIIAGAIQGSFFHKEDWLGGYKSWRRRMTRLGHISLFGIAIINLAFVFTVYALDIKQSIFIPSILFIIGAVTMPLVCYLSAFKKFFRNFFFIPVLSILAGTLIFIIGGLF
jgi:hypothetical protein